MARRGPKGKCGKRIYFSEIDAKIALARLVWKDSGESRIYKCNICTGRVYHVTSQEQKTEVKRRVA